MDWLLAPLRSSARVCDALRVALQRCPVPCGSGVCALRVRPLRVTDMPACRRCARAPGGDVSYADVLVTGETTRYGRERALRRIERRAGVVASLSAMCRRCGCVAILCADGVPVAHSVVVLRALAPLLT